jgi:hypothetical protein
MATGERKFSTAGREVKKYNFKPLTPGDWDLKVDASQAAIGKKNEPGKFPYINGIRFEALDSADEGGKNKLVFHMLFTSLKPGKDGSAMVDRQDQVVALAKALGEDSPDLPIITMPDENGVKQDVIEPKALLAWLKSHNGKIIKAHTKIQKGDGTYEPRSVVAYFIEAEGAAGPSDESEGFGQGVDEDAPEGFGEEQTEEAPEEEAPEEEAPPPPPPARKAAPSKAPAKPAPKRR